MQIQDYAIVPDTIYLAEQPKICIMETLDYDIPVDFKKMFDISLYSINNNLLRDVINTYEKLNVQYEPLKIIKPQFEIPYYLQLAVICNYFPSIKGFLIHYIPSYRFFHRFSVTYQPHHWSCSIWMKPSAANVPK